MFVYASMCYIPSLTMVAAIQWAETSTAALYKWVVVVGGSFLVYICIMTAQRPLRPTVVSMYNYMQPIIGFNRYSHNRYGYIQYGKRYCH